MKEIVVRRAPKEVTVQETPRPHPMSPIVRDIERMKDTGATVILPGWLGKKAQQWRTETVRLQGEAITAKVGAMRAPLEAQLALENMQDENQSNSVKRILENQKLAAEVKKAEAEARISELVYQDRLLTLEAKRKEMEDDR